MELVIFCGGEGTRLREETIYIPKPMIQIGNRPIIWHILKSYAHYGVKDFTLALGYKGEVIREYFLFYELMNRNVTFNLSKREEIKFHDDHDENDWKITLADTGENTLKGGRLKRVEQFVTGENFLLTYGDGLADVDIRDLISFHKTHGKLATVTGVNPFARFGELKLRDNQVVVFAEKPELADDYVNGGFFVFNRGIFDFLRADEDCDLEVGPLETVAQKGEMMVYKHNGFWACMDTQRDRDYLNALWSNGKAPWKVW